MVVAVVVCRGSRRIAAGSSHVCGAGRDSCSCRNARQPPSLRSAARFFGRAHDAAAAFWRQNLRVSLVGRLRAPLGRILGDVSRALLASVLR